MADRKAPRKPVTAHPRKKESHDHEDEHREQTIHRDTQESLRLVLRMIAHQKNDAHHVATRRPRQELVKEGTDKEQF